MNTDHLQNLWEKGPPFRSLGVVAEKVAELWHYRFLLRSLVVRDLRVKYQRSALGFVWTFLNPLLTVAILVVVFSVVIRIQLLNYWAFLLSGFFVWNTVQQTLLAGSFIFSQHAQLTRSVAFPKEILLFSGAISRLIEFAAEILLILIILVLVHHHSIPSSLLLLPYLIALQFLLTVGIMFPVSIASILFTDVQHALPVIFTSLFYLTPVFYPAEMIPQLFRPLYFLNPFAGLLTLFHRVLYEGRMPSLGLLAGTTTAACVLFLVGYALFDRYKDICNELV